MTTIVADLLPRCARVATSTWSDVLDRLGIEGVVSGLTLRSGVGCVAGVALTVRETVAPLGTHPPDAFAVATFLDAVQSGAMLVIDMGGADVSSCGGLGAIRARGLGAAGVVIDGACRDLADIRATGLWVASRHVTPKSGSRRAKVEGINVPVTIGGVRVHAGDYVVGDETGVIVIPADRLADALPLGEELAAKDARFADALRAGQSFSSTAARLGHV